MTTTTEMVTVDSGLWSVTTTNEIHLTSRGSKPRPVILGCTALDAPRLSATTPPPTLERLRLSDLIRRRRKPAEEPPWIPVSVLSRELAEVAEGFVDLGLHVNPRTPTLGLTSAIIANTQLEWSPTGWEAHYESEPIAVQDFLRDYARRSIPDIGDIELVDANRALLDFPLPVFGSPPHEFQRLQYILANSGAIAATGYLASTNHEAIAVIGAAGSALLWFAKPGLRVARRGFARRIAKAVGEDLTDDDLA